MNKEFCKSKSYKVQQKSTITYFLQELKKKTKTKQASKLKKPDP